MSGIRTLFLLKPFLMRPIKIGIVLYNGCTSSMVTGIWDILTQANYLYREQKGHELFHLELIAATKASIESFSGLRFTPHRTIRSRTNYDLIYVPGFIGSVESILAQEHKTIQWLSSQGKSRKTVLSAACNGNFLLAESGVLNNKKATTHWSLVNMFREKYGQVSLLPEKIIVDNGSVISAAGVTAYFNLGLHIIQRFADADLSLACAKIFLVDAGRKLQNPYQMFQLPKSHGDELIIQVQEWMESNYREKASATKLAGMVKLGEKTMFRRFKKATGDTPQLYLQKLRIETAKRLLESKDMTFNEVTWEVGYSDVSSFHKAFKIETGLTPGGYRDRFFLGSNYKL